MSYSFHPAEGAEFLGSVGYYESKVSGLGGAFIEEFEALVTLVGESAKAWQVELEPDICRAPLHRFPLSIVYRESLTVFRCWLLLMTGDVRSTGLAGFNNRLHGDRFSAASQRQTGARAGRYVF